MYQQLSAPSSYTYSSSTGSNSNNLETLARYSRESAFVTTGFGCSIMQAEGSGEQFTINAHQKEILLAISRQ